MNTPTLHVIFFATAAGSEPVREWLKSLSAIDKKTIGEDIKTVQLGWPLGMPLVRKLAKDLWEVRIHLVDRIARVLFTVVSNTMVLLHGFIKKSQATPVDDLETAKARMKQIKGER
jgi:phage-related protein